MKNMRGRSIYMCTRLHQSMMCVFQVWYTIYYMTFSYYGHVITSFFMSVPMHSSMAFTWVVLVPTHSIIGASIASIALVVNLMVSLVFIVSLDHWSMWLFLCMAFLMPIIVFFGPLLLASGRGLGWMWSNLRRVISKRKKIKGE